MPEAGVGVVHFAFSPRGSAVSGRQTELCKFGPLDPVCLPYSFVKMSMAWDTFSRRSSQSAGGDNCAAGTTSVRTTRLLRSASGPSPTAPTPDHRSFATCRRTGRCLTGRSWPGSRRPQPGPIYHPRTQEQILHAAQSFFHSGKWEVVCGPAFQVINAAPPA